ncbi:MAG: heme-binding protein [Limisphaerales bacterium]
MTILLAVAALAFVGCQATRAGYESAPYQVVRTDGDFELRIYPALTVVETTMTPAANSADGSFSRLFRFITGGNDAKEKIAMTTPVFMSGSESNRMMAFVLPAKFEAAKVPRPADASVTVRTLAAGQFAVLRFTGGRSAKHEAAALEKLKSWVLVQGLKVSPPPVYAYFDPPWTPSFLRRNEVMLRTEPGQQ